MEIAQILSKLDIALCTLFSNDLYLIERDLGERSVAYKLAEYLQPLFNGFNVDCEYNGDATKQNDIKALNIAAAEIAQIGMDPNEANSYRISPDIIIHLRGHNETNLVAIEVKKDNSLKKFKDFDLIKLRYLTSDLLGNRFNYRLGMALTYNTGKNAGTKAEVFFQNGNRIENRQGLT